MKSRRILWISLAIVLIAAITGSWYVISRENARKSIDSYQRCVGAGYPVQASFPERCVVPDGNSFTNPNTTEQSITVEGKIVCLPHKNADGPHTMECTSGLRTNDGGYYELKTKSPDSELASAAGGDRKVKVHGTFKPQASDRYKSEGLITIESYEFI